MTQTSFLCISLPYALLDNPDFKMLVAITDHRYFLLVQILFCCNLSPVSTIVVVLVASHVCLLATPRTVAHQALLSKILLARILEWVAIPFSRGSSQPRVQTRVSCVAGRFFTILQGSPCIYHSHCRKLMIKYVFPRRINI